MELLCASLSKTLSKNFSSEKLLQKRCGCKSVSLTGTAGYFPWARLPAADSDFKTLSLVKLATNIREADKENSDSFGMKYRKVNCFCTILCRTLCLERLWISVLQSFWLSQPFLIDQKGVLDLWLVWPIVITVMLIIKMPSCGRVTALKQLTCHCILP